MNRRTFLSALAGLPVIGKYWKPKETLAPLSPESLTDAPCPFIDVPNGRIRLRRIEELPAMTRLPESAGFVTYLFRGFPLEEDASLPPHMYILTDGKQQITFPSWKGLLGYHGPRW